MSSQSSNKLVMRILERMEGPVDVLQFLLSVLAVAFVVANQFVTPTWTVPWVDFSWQQMQVVVRVTTWAVFVATLIISALASGRPFSYLRKHVPELVVCLTWIPYYDGAVLQHVSSWTSLEMLTVAGSIAHAWRVARWTVRRFSEHPLIVIAVAVAVLVGSCSALLTHFEPETFPTMAESAWFCVVTIFTVGYGDLVPVTPTGRLIATGLIVSGVALAGVFIGFISKIVSQKLLDKDQQNEDEGSLAKKVAENNRLLQEMIAEQRQANELNRQLLADLARLHEKDKGDQPPDKTDDT